MSDARGLSVMEQRYQAVLAVVQDGWKVSVVVTGDVTVEPRSTSGSSPPASTPTPDTRHRIADRPIAVG